MGLKDRIISIVTGQSSDTANEIQVCIGRFQHYDEFVKAHEFNILQFHRDSVLIEREDPENYELKIKDFLPQLMEDKKSLKKAKEQRENALNLLYKAVEENQLKYHKYLKDSHGLERKSMPQIDYSNIDSIVQDLKDDDIKVLGKTVKITKIKPSQKDFNENKVLAMLKDGSENINVEYLISKDGFLVDGHHRWAAALEEDDKQNVKVYQVNLNIDDLLKKVKDLNLTYKEEEDEPVEKAEVDAAMTILEAAYLAGQIDEKIIIKARLDKTNLVAERRQVVRENGTVYLKTFYVRREEKSSSLARNYILQDDYEDRMQVGDKVKVHFTGYSSGSPYEGKAKIDEITPTHIKVSLIEEVETHNRNSYVYRVGDSNSTFKIPRTTNKEWNQKQRIEPLQIEAPEVPQEGTREIAPIEVTHVNQVSRGDSVKFEHGGNKVTGKISSIWAQSNGKVRLTIKDNAGREYYKQIGGRSKIYKVGVETGSSAPTSHHPETYTTTDQTFDQLRGLGVNISESNKAALKQCWNGSFKNFNPVAFVTEIRTAIKSKFGPMVSSNLSISFHADGNDFSFDLDHSKVVMTRKFKYNNGNREVYHALFRVTKSAQGGDLGKNLFKALYKQYQNCDVKKISINANIDVGGYAWGKYGFKTQKSEAEGLAHMFERYKGISRTIKEAGATSSYSITQADVDAAKNVVSNFYRRNSESTLFPVKLLCDIAGGKAGKAALAHNGCSWHGEINLTKPEERLVFENYINSTR